MALLPLIVTIAFTLGVETFALHRFLGWKWGKALGCSVLLNVASLLAVNMVYAYVTNQLPLHWFRLYHLHTQFHLHELLLLGSAFVAVIVAESLLCKLLDREADFGRVLAIVAGMNVVTFTPGAIEQYVRDLPSLPEPFALLERAEWLDVADTIYYFDFNTRTIVARNADGSSVLSFPVAPPAHGYRITDNNSKGLHGVACLALSNILSVGVVDTNGAVLRTARIACTATNPAFVALSPGLDQVAIWDADGVRVYPVDSKQPPLAEIAVTGEVNAIGWSLSGRELACLRNGQFSVLPTNSWQMQRLTGDQDIGLASSYQWALEDFMATSAVFHAGGTTATVYQLGGIRVDTPVTSLFFTVQGAGARRPYLGTGFLSDHSTFIFQLRHERGWELMALDTRTWRVGHLADGVMALLHNPRYAVGGPPAVE